MAAILHGGGLSAACARYGGTESEWLDLSTGINPNPAALPPIPPEIWNRLPDSGLVAVARQAAQSWYLPEGTSDGVFPLPVPGTQALIQILPRLVPQARPVAVQAPTYGEYAHCFRRAGFVVDEIGNLGELRPDHGTLVVVNPNNPDGRVFSRAELEALAVRMTAQGGHLHVDEAFGDLRPELSLAALAGTMPHLTVSRSFGKVFGMAGVRLGFVFADASVLQAIEAEMGPWPVSGPALYIAAEVMGQSRETLATAIAARRVGLETVLTSAGLNVAGGTELFALVQHQAAGMLFDSLARAHILVRKFDYAPEWLRIGLAPDGAGDRRLAEALAAMDV